jgi:enamine deaminase RidA (YjgF/YER057c/UK114 family)
LNKFSSAKTSSARGATACLPDILNTLPTEERYDLKMSKPLLSRVRRAGRVLYLSGIIGRGDTKESKFRDTFERIKGVLEENGLSLEDVVKATVYLEDINDRPKYLNPLWREYFPDNPPTRTCVEAGLNGGQIEITAVAAIPD